MVQGGTRLSWHRRDDGARWTTFVDLMKANKVFDDKLDVTKPHDPIQNKAAPPPKRQSQAALICFSLRSCRQALPNGVGGPRHSFTVNEGDLLNRGSVGLRQEHRAPLIADLTNQRRRDQMERQTADARLRLPRRRPFAVDHGRIQRAPAARPHAHR
jgi:hypothetical protein